ncbi:MAG TPA: hypothetical protein VIS48_08225 [Candidatus Kryptonia bacterium]
MKTFLLVCSLLIVCGLNVQPLYSQSRLELTSKILDSPREKLESSEIVAVHKSPTLAAVASLAVPGLGELYAGRYDVGKYSTITEVSLWVFYTAIEMYSDQLRNDAINYARVNAGVNAVGKNDLFFVNIGNYLNTADYNVKKIHDGDFGAMYNVTTYQWQWQSDAQRERFKDLRIRADQYLDYGRYTAGVIVLNHLISAVSAARLASIVNARATATLNDFPGTTGLYLNLSADF